MTEMELYKLWCEKAVDDPDLQTELKSIEGDEAAIQMIETDGGNVYGYSENYQLSNKDAGVNKEP